MRTENNTLIPETVVDAYLLQAAAASTLPSIYIRNAAGNEFQAGAQAIRHNFSAGTEWSGGRAFYETGGMLPEGNLVVAGIDMGIEQDQRLEISWTIHTTENETIYAEIQYLNTLTGALYQSPTDAVETTDGSVGVIRIEVR